MNIFQAVVDAIGIAALILVTLYYPVRNLFGMFFFIALTTVAESQSIWMRDHETISVSSAVVIAATMVYGPTTAVWASAISVFGSISRRNSKISYHILNIPFPYTLFNICNYSIAAAVISVLYDRLHGQQIRDTGSMTLVLQQISANAPQLLAAVFAGVLCNAILFGIFQWINRGVGSFSQVVHYLVLPTINLFFICLLGAFLTAVYVEYHWFMVALLFLPFMLARYVFITYKDLQQNYLQTVESLAAAVETKDEYTSGHSQRVEKYSSLIAREMKLSAHRCETIRYAALLHDIGKIGIPETVLNKPGRLTEEEMAMIRQHPEKGAHIVGDIEFLSDAVEIIRSHHERYSGGGYPTGKPARDMPLEAMILCVADAFDAMTSDRSYRKAMTKEEALRELRRGAGTQFSPQVVAAFEKVLKQHPQSAAHLDIHI